MSRDLGTKDLTLVGSERTFLIQINTPLGEDPEIRVNRERIWQRSGTQEVVSREVLPPIKVKASQIANFDFGNGVTGAVLATQIALAGDKLADASDSETGPFAPPA